MRKSETGVFIEIDKDLYKKVRAKAVEKDTNVRAIVLEAFNKFLEKK